jgi:putative lipoic acid-binding regulatory protein
MAEREEEKKVIFPQNFDIKVIVEASVPIDECKANISQVFSKCKVVHSFISVRSSAKGNYITYTYNIDLDSQEQMNAVYDGLKQVPGIKFAL